MQSFHSIQHLRAIAALGIVIAHLEIYLGRIGYAGAWPNFLTAGVDLFFVISGFIMGFTTATRPITPLRFMRNRILRIVPLYWCVSAFALAILVLNKELMPRGALDWDHVARSFLFLPALHPVIGELQPLVTAGWTLNYEMMFYALFAATLLAPERIRLLVALIVLTSLACLRLINPAPMTALWFYSSSLVLEFGFGLMVAAFITSGRRLPTALAAGLVAVGAISLIGLSEIAALDAYRAAFRGVPAALIVLGAVACEANGAALSSRLMTFLGDASYSIYLTHGILLSAFTRGWQKLLPPWIAESLAAFCLAGFLAAATGGALVYLAVERPLGRFCKRLLEPGAGRRAEPARL